MNYYNSPASQGLLTSPTSSTDKPVWWTVHGIVAWQQAFLHIALRSLQDWRHMRLGLGQTSEKPQGCLEKFGLGQFQELHDGPPVGEKFR